MADLANNPLRSAREKAGLNIKEMADLLGAPYRTVQDWNLGKHLPPEWMARLIISEVERQTKNK